MKTSQNLKKKNENITHILAMPIQLCYCDYESSPLHWHPELELFFVLDGTASVHVEHEVFTVVPEDIFLINANDSHSVDGVNAKMLSLRFRMDGLPFSIEKTARRFNLNSSGKTASSKYNYIRHLIAQFVRSNLNGEHVYKSLSIVYALYSHLTDNFLAPPLSAVSSSRRNRERTVAIMQYMEEHYREGLTLTDVAGHFGLSAPYLTSFFEKNTGKTFLTYYNEIRLTHAVDMLLTTKEPIGEIALSNGFSDSRSFLTVFKKKYGTLPSVYRREHAYADAESRHPQDSPGESLFLDQHAIRLAQGFPNLMKYQRRIGADPTELSIASDYIKYIDAGSLSFASDGVGLTHNYHRMLCVGSARQFLYREVQDMLIRAQKEIGYSYVKFHGILSDEMMVYTEKDGQAVHSYALIDKVFDFLISVHIRPLVELAFMPVALAEDPNRLVDFYHFNTSPPKDMNKWINLVTDFTRHCVRRYGLQEVRQWMFCVWNEPDDTVTEFSWHDPQRFYDFYCDTYRAVKAVDDRLMFGTPSLLLSLSEENGWAGNFFRYLKTTGCRPDFLNVHYYDNTLFDCDSADRHPKVYTSTENMGASFPMTADPYAFMKFINSLKFLHKKYHMKTIPIYLTEWNLTISHRDLINDTCFKACYLVKNLLENYDRMESFSYWSLTDFIEELQLPEQLFHGGLGLFTYNGIPKSHYNMFCLLGRLQDELIGKGDGYFITRGERKVVMVAYNYEHFSKLFAEGHRTESDRKNRYATFSKMDSAEFTVTLTDLPGEKCLVKEHFINQANGSSYDAWVKMGSQPLDDPKDMELLKQLSQPGLFLHPENITDHKLSLRVQMAPLEVRLIEIDLL